MNRSIRPSLLAILIAAISSCANGSEAFFSADGKSVITSLGGAFAETGLRKIDLATGDSTVIPLPAALKDAEISSIARGAEGEILFLAKDAVWVVKDGEAARKVVSTAPVKNPRDLFVGTKKGSPLEDWLFISGVEEETATSQGTFYARKPGAKIFETIFCRRVDDALAGAFTADDRLIFVSSADLWLGNILPNPDGEGWRGVLVGDRLAPLAFLNTDEANGGGMWVREVSPAGKWIYAALKGRHMAAIVRTPLPVLKPAGEESDGHFQNLKASYASQAQALTKTEIIADDLEDVFGFCAAEIDGKPHIFYFTRAGEDEKGPPLMLWTGAGAAKVIGHFPKPKE